MTRSLSLFLFAGALGMFAIGCTRDCEDNCEDQKECVGGDKSIDCAHKCEEERTLNEKAGCEDLYDKYLSCTGNSDDICTVGDSCEAEANKWNACVVAYCEKNTDVCDKSKD